MQKIINGRMYNTNTATEIGWRENTANRGDYSYYREYLYRKKTGEFFLYGYGNAASKYCQSDAVGMREPGKKIVPMSEDEAKTWVERYCDVDTYIELFGAVEE